MRMAEDYLESSAVSMRGVPGMEGVFCFHEHPMELAWTRPPRRSIIERMNEYIVPEWMPEYGNFKTLCAHACGEYIRYYLTTGHEGVQYTHSQRSDGQELPLYTCRLSDYVGNELLLRTEDWHDRLDDVSGTVRRWIRDHVDLRDCRLEPGRYQGDPYWKQQVFHDNE